MSSTLTIEPTCRKKKTLSSTLKFAIKKRFDGLSSRIFGESDINYFQGLADAGIEDAQLVIDMIEKYQEVTITEEY